MRASLTKGLNNLDVSARTMVGIVEEFQNQIRDRTGIEIERDSINLPNEKPATESFGSFVRFLFEEDYLSKEDLPIRSGHIRYVLNKEPLHQDGTEMTRPLEVVDGIFLERNYNKDGIKRKIRQLYRTVQTEFGD